MKSIIVLLVVFGLSGCNVQEKTSSWKLFQGRTAESQESAPTLASILIPIYQNGDGMSEQVAKMIQKLDEAIDVNVPDYGLKLTTAELEQTQRWLKTTSDTEILCELQNMGIEVMSLNTEDKILYSYLELYVYPSVKGAGNAIAAMSYR